MLTEEPDKLLVYPWVDKELTFEWHVIQVGEGLSERNIRNGEPKEIYKY